MAEDKPLSGPDFKSGVEFDKLVENEPMLGNYESEPVVLVRRGDQVFAVGAACTHYGGPLAEGLVVGDTIRCPWHHARFSLHTGEAEGAPALNPISCFDVRRQGDEVAITGKRDVDFHVTCPQSPSSVVVIGAGAAGAACVDMLRTKGYPGPITLVGEEQPSPVDRPNLSKDYLAGSAPEEWIPLRTPDYYQSNRVDLVPGNPAIHVRPDKHQVALRDGRTLNYGALLLATGAEPRSLPIEGADRPHVYRLRTLADSQAIIAKAQQAKKCVVIGSSFIGLEAAASLRSRECEVTVISQDSVPLEKLLGAELGRFVQRLHEHHGVRFLLDTKPRAIHNDKIEIGDGRSVDADMVILGVGVSPRTSLAEEAGVKIGDGVIVDEMLRTSATDIFAAGDIARYPESISGESARIEHWVVAERQGQAVARAMLGIGGPFRQTPFFWSQHYDVAIAYVGHASQWDSCEIKGDLEKNDATAVYRRNKKIMAVATIGRDRLSLQVEAAMEGGRTGDLESILEANT
jgi:NADPH-dependent 2,4-dienoyl-CoA reductase/sulfur reductase-like enzyme/nitrite reductase/ring-hydroxylating ferredoxin subunit